MEYCETCIQVPEMERVALKWEHPESGVGINYCPLCEHIYSAYNCPYIPEFMATTEG